MLDEIKKAEQEAEHIVEEARRKAEDIVRIAREKALHLIQETEEAIRIQKTAALSEGAQTGSREAEKIAAKAQKDIEKEEAEAKNAIQKAADALYKKVKEAL